MTRASAAAALLALALVASPAQSQDFLSGEGPSRSTKIEQHLNQQIPLNAEFRDETGKKVMLGQYMKNKPVLLQLAYFSCPMLCNMVLDGTLAAVSNIKLQPGKDYEILTVSFDPRDTPALAKEKKDIYARRFGRPGASDGWHFLTGDAKQIARLTSAVGFRYAWDPKTKQFAHGAATIVLTADGRVSRYFYGIDYPARDLRLGLVEASQNKIGGLADQLLLLCFHYDPATGRYARSAMNVVRFGSVATLLGIAGTIGFLLRKEKRGSPS